MLSFKSYLNISKLFADELTKNSLKYNRQALPQIKDIMDFKQFLLKNHVTFYEKTIDPGGLSPTQKHLNPDKIAALLSGKFDSNKPIIVSWDGYVLDGHHRWAVAVIRNEPIKALVVNMNIDFLLALVNDNYENAQYHSIK